MNRWKIYAAFLLWGCCASIAKGQTGQEAQVDSVFGGIEKQDTAVYFNALKYSLQKRYRPENREFRNGKFVDNTFLSIMAGTEKLFLRDYSTYNAGPAFSVAFGKAINPGNAFRALLSGHVMSGTDYDKHNRLAFAGLQLEHMLNFSSYIAGYNPSRFFELSTVEGLGYHLSFLDGRCRQAADVHLGIQLKLHPAPQVDVVLEPRVTVYTDKIDHADHINGHSYNMGYGFWLGLNYHFSSVDDEIGKRYAFRNAGFLDNFFVAASGGVATVVPTKSVGNSMGQVYTLSVGKWFMPVFGLRLSGFVMEDKWGVEVGDGKGYYSNRIGGARVEGMMNLLSLFSPKLVDSSWKLNVLLGLETGKLAKEMDLGKSKLDAAYVGFTGALQFQYTFLEHYGFFIEPRFSQVPYKLDILQPDGVTMEATSYSDKHLSLNVGFQYTF